MKCRHVKKMISPYMDGVLTQDEKKGFEAHVRSCASCRKALEETMALHRLFASAQRFPTPYGFSTRVLANLDDKEGSRARGIFVFRPLFLRAAQVAFALVVVTIGILSGGLLLEERTNNLGQRAVQETFSLELFRPTPPGSIGRIYNSLMRPSNER